MQKSTAPKNTEHRNKQKEPEGSFCLFGIAITIARKASCKDVVGHAELRLRLRNHKAGGHFVRRISAVNHL